MAYTPATRLYSEAVLAAGMGVALDEAQTHYLRNVLRLGAGARIALFNGRDGEWWAEIESLGRREGTVRLLECRRAPRPEPAPEAGADRLSR
jgi:16S rRNA (uracil1498-N3)-methyltransferase